MREIVHLQAGQCGNQIGAKVSYLQIYFWMQFIDFNDAYFLKQNEQNSQNQFQDVLVGPSKIRVLN